MTSITPEIEASLNSTHSTRLEKLAKQSHQLALIVAENYVNRKSLKS